MTYLLHIPTGKIVSYKPLDPEEVIGVLITSKRTTLRSIILVISHLPETEVYTKEEFLIVN